MNRSADSAPQADLEGEAPAATPASNPERSDAAQAPPALAGNPGEAGPRAEGERGEGERGEGERGERGRRRGRRDRRRGEPGEGGDGGNRPRNAAPLLPLPPNFEGPMPRHLQPVVPAEAGEIFAKLLSGEFDTDSEAVEVVEAEEVASKRVLATESDAPKLHKVLAQAGIGSDRKSVV